MVDLCAFRYRATAVDTAGRNITEVFTSNVEYLPGDELPLSSARWRVRTVSDEGISVHGGRAQIVRHLRCMLASG